MAVKFAEAIKNARAQLNELTGLVIESTVSAEPEEDGWRVLLEAVEKKSIPESMDILGIYETRLDEEGNMIEFNRIKMRKRIDTEDI